MKKIINPVLLIIISLLLACSQKPSNEFSLTIMQLNDVYEISPMNNGKVAGLARVATLRNQLLAENNNTISLLAGDFLSPSIIGTMKVDGKRVGGEHMIETLNALGLDYATFGNHEFDLKEKVLQSRLDESKFKWTSANTFHQTDSGVFNFTSQGKDIPKYIIHEIKNENGKIFKLGIISITLAFNKQEYIKYEEIFTSFGEVYNTIQNKCDAVIAMTHLNIADDIKLAEQFPDLLMILGGHEHVNIKHEIGNVLITKADANAKTVYVHKLVFNNKKVNIASDLVDITDAIAEDAKVKVVVDKWELLVNSNMSSLGYEPDMEIYKTDEELNVLESDIRNGATNFTQLVMKAFEYGYPKADAHLVNSGSIRLDDVLTGSIYQYDILKSFPYGGSLVLVELTGETLQKTLEISTTINKNTGGYLQTGKISFENEVWKVASVAIIPSKKYKVLLPSFLAAGYESNLGFLGDAPSSKLETLGPNKVKNDIRNIVIDYLKNLSTSGN